MQPLQIIKHALDSTISLINKGEKPSSALEKVAKELDLNSSYIQRTGEALNVALTYGHFKTASDKSVDFDIADIPAITKNIFSEREKTANQKKAEWFPEVQEDVDYNKFLTNPGFKKSAAEIKKTNANFDSYETSYKGQMKKAVDYMSRLDREVDELQTEKVANEFYVENAFLNLISGFKKTAEARVPFHEFESQAYATYGERAVPYIDLLYKSAELSEERGERDAKYINFTPCRELNVFDSFLKAAAQKAELQASLIDAEQYVAQQKNNYKQACYKLNPMAMAFEKSACEALIDDLDDLVKEAGDDRPGGMGRIHELIEKVYNTATKQDVKSPVFKNTSMDNRERMMLLQDLIMTDDILKKQDPRKIIQAYQQILRLAPHISLEKDVVRAQLRQMLAGQALHPTDANQLVEANTNMMKQHQLLHSVENGEKKDKK